jgi:hypothetical protein
MLFFILLYYKYIILIIYDIIFYLMLRKYTYLIGNKSVMGRQEETCIGNMLCSKLPA